MQWFRQMVAFAWNCSLVDWSFCAAVCFELLQEFPSATSKSGLMGNWIEMLQRQFSLLSASFLSLDVFDCLWQRWLDSNQFNSSASFNVVSSLHPMALLTSMLDMLWHQHPMWQAHHACNENVVLISRTTKLHKSFLHFVTWRLT